MKITIDTENQLLELDGVKLHFNALLQIIRPDPNALVRFERKGDQIQANIFRVKEGQSGD